jgi:uncharacterized membrane-anchored protein YhcB (DUF1043 family)
MFSELRWEVVVHFVDTGGIVDHHTLYCPFSYLYIHMAASVARKLKENAMILTS